MDAAGLAVSLLGLAEPISKVIELARRTNNAAEASRLAGNEVGLINLYSVPGAAPQVDVVLVHGFQGSATQTWTSREGICWPRDLLPKEKKFENIRVLSFGYSALLKENPTSLDDLGHILLRELCLRRSNWEECPIVFFAHSLGGLIIKSALAHSDNSIDISANSIVSATKGVCFFGTPNGNAGRDLWQQSFDLEKLLAPKSGIPNREIGALLDRAKRDETMSMLSRRFRRLAKKYSISILSFYETRPTSTRYGRVLVVRRTDVKVGMMNEEVVGLDTDHMGLTRISDPSERSFRHIYQFLDRLLSGHLESVLGVQQIMIPPLFGSESYHTEQIPQSIDLIGREHVFLDSLKSNWLETTMIIEPHPATCSWVLRNRQYKEWLHRDPASLAIVGRPGEGKTVLAKFLVNQVRPNIVESGPDSLKTVNYPHIEYTHLDVTSSTADTLAKGSNPSLKTVSTGGSTHSYWTVSSGNSSSSYWTASTSNPDPAPLLLCVAYFFDERVKSRATYEDFLRAMLYQILVSNRIYFKHIYGRASFFAGTEFTNNIAEEVLGAIIRDSAERGGIAIVVDAIDECREESRIPLVNFLESLQSCPGVKLITTGRKKFVKAPMEIVLSTEIAHKPGHSRLSRSEPRSGFAEYVRFETEKLSHRRTLPADLCEEIIETLSKQGRNYLMLQLWLRQIETQRTISGCRRVLNKLPRNMDDIVWGYISPLPDEEKKRLLRILYFVSEAKGPISVHGLSFLMSRVSDDGEEQTRTTRLKDIMENIDMDFETELSDYAPLIQIKEGTVTLMHSNLKKSLKPGKISQRFNDPWWLYNLFEIQKKKTDKHDPTKRNTRPVLLDYGVNTKYLRQDIAGSDKPPSPTPAQTVSRVHAAMAEACLVYFLAAYRDQSKQPLHELPSAPGNAEGSMLRIKPPDPLNFLEYSTMFWKSHTQDGRTALTTRQFKLIKDILPFPPHSPRQTAYREIWTRKYKAPLESDHISELPKTKQLEHWLAALNLCRALGQFLEREDLEDSLWRRPESNSSPWTPLHYAAANNSLKSLMWIIVRFYENRSQGFISIDWSKTDSPLHKAVAFGHQHIVDVLVEMLRVRNALPKFGVGLHQAAANFGQRHIFLYLWSRRSDLNLVPLGTPEECSAALSSAITLRCDEIVEVVLKGADSSMLHNGHFVRTAVKAGSSPILRSLIRYGANVSGRDELASGQEPIHVAADMGNEQMTEILLDAGAEANAQDDIGRTPLHVCCEHGFDAIACLLIRRGAIVNFQDDEMKSPAHYAAGSGNVTLAKTLLEHGANLFAIDDNGMTVLAVAAEAGHDAIVQLLISKRADIHSMDNQGRTPLHHAVGSGSSKVVFSLIKAGADPSTKNESGQTPLHLAVLKGFYAIVGELLECSADPNALDKDNKSPMDYFIDSDVKVDSVFNALIDAGAKTSYHKESDMVKYEMKWRNRAKLS